MSENLGDAVRQALSGASGDRVRQAAAMSGAPYVPHPPHGSDRECPEAVSALDQARAEVARLRDEVDMLRPLADQRDAAHEAADAAEESDQRLRRAMAWIALRVRGGREIVDKALDMSVHDTHCAEHLGRGPCDCVVSR